jgi:transcriptional regulator with XRE-family HTH domain
MKPIGKQIRQRRAAEGISQIQLGARAGVSHNMISRIETRKGQNTSLATLRALADALDCDLVVKLKPREPARPDDFYTQPGEGIVSFGVDYAKIDPKDAEIQATMHEIVSRIQALPWDLVGPLGEGVRAHTLAFLHDGDLQTAWAYLNLMQERVQDAEKSVDGVVSFGVDYGKPGADHTASIGIVRLDEQTTTFAPPTFAP